MTTQLSKAYQLVYDAAQKVGCTTLNVPDIEVEICEADAELASDEAGFERNLRSACTALAKDDSDGLTEYLIRLRISAMNLSTIFSNFSEELERILKIGSAQDSHGTE